MPFLQGNFPLVRREQIAPDIFDFWVACPPIASGAAAGQFVQMKAPGFFLRRPISICEIDREAGALRFVFQVRGEGTAALSEMTPGSRIDFIGPLGNGFSLPPAKENVVVVGGGIGVPPLLETAKAAGKNVTAILGFRCAENILLQQDFISRGCEVSVATDDGSAGHHGLVTELLERRLGRSPVSLICACGPMPMLKGVADLGARFGVPTQVSLEEHMACGVGACLVCACKTVRDGREIYAHVCKDGPVFDAGEVVF